MPQQRPMPSAEKVLGNMIQCAGNPPLVWNAALKIFAATLPAAIALANTRLGYGLEPIGGYAVVGDDLSKVARPTLVVGATVHSDAFTPGGYGDQIQLVCYALCGPMLDRKDIDNSMSYALLLRGALVEFQRGYWDDAGRRIWSSLALTDIVPGPNEWSQHKGWQAHFLVFQAPGPDLWQAPSA